MTDRTWTDADRELLVSVLWTRALQANNAGVQLDRQPAADAPAHVWADAAAVLDALTADGWRPPPPTPDGVHWRTGGSVGCTIYSPYGDLSGMMRTPEAAAAVVAVLNTHAEAAEADTALRTSGETLNEVAEDSGPTEPCDCSCHSCCVPADVACVDCEDDHSADTAGGGQDE